MARNGKQRNRTCACARILSRFASMFAVTVCASFADAQVPCRYEYVQWPNSDCGFGPFPGDPVAVNVHGHVCGRWGSCGNPVTHTFIWNGSGPITILPIPAGYRSMTPTAMNDMGEIVGYLELLSGPVRAFVRKTNGQVIDLGLPPNSTNSQATGINNQGQIVGYSGGVVGNRAFLWTNGVFQTLELQTGQTSRAHAINDDSQITGYIGSQATASAFIWQGTDLQIFGPVPGGTSAQGRALSSHGRVVGYGNTNQDGIPVVRSFSYHNNQMFDIGTLPGYTWSRALACDDSVILGRAEEGVENPVVFIWSNGQNRRLSDLVLIADLRFTSDAVIASNGRIAARGGVNEQWIGLLLTPVYAPRADINADCQVGVADLLMVIRDWGLVVSPADINDDQTVNVTDLLLVIQQWTHLK